jgi:transitional endoplasmic reticulum ATPase
VKEASAAQFGLNKLEESGIYFESVPPEVWDEIAGMTNEKKLIDSTIVLPLQHPEVAIKHGVTPPKAMLCFGPPGTGKTFFAKGIAGRLGWFFIEISPSDLLREGLDKLSLNLKGLFERFLSITHAVVFLDEFEQLALRPDAASEREKLVSSEMLRQIPRFRAGKELLLICATNNIRLLNPALLRPGRFDYILPVGPLDLESRKAIFQTYLSRMNVDEIDLSLISEKTRYYTPADIQAVCARAAQTAFEKEIAEKAEHKVQTGDLLQTIEMHQPTTTPEQLKEFKDDVLRFCRTEYCDLLLEPS